MIDALNVLPVFVGSESGKKPKKQRNNNPGVRTQVHAKPLNCMKIETQACVVHDRVAVHL
jgi:hypothetical protein